MLALLFAFLLAAPLASLAADADAPPLASTTRNTSSAAHESPLVAYAMELNSAQSPSEIKAAYIANTNLRAVNFEMSRHPPPADADCAHTLGARRFAEQYAHLAAIQDELGNFEAVIAAYRSALACEPRVATHEAFVASAHLSLGQIDPARAAIERAYAMDPDDAEVRNTRARIDFIQERWADATARFRLETLGRGRYASEYVDYSRCYLWLAQRRAGVRNPELPPRHSEEKKSAEDTKEDDPKTWPRPILETLRGNLSEADLVKAIRETGAPLARERLTEALYYIGELRLAEGDAETARRHFAAVVNLRMLNFLEYGMARAELAKMRERNPVTDTATVAAGGTTAPR